VWSVVQERSVALGLLTDGRARIGQEVFVRLPDQVLAATVTAPVFHDPKGARLRS
jgi:sarcosine oxidase subunit alpha